MLRTSFLAVAVGCALGALSPSAQAGFPESTGAARTASAPPAVVSAATLDGVDLRVELTASAAGSLQLLDRSGQVISTAPIAPIGPGSELAAPAAPVVVFGGILPRLLGGSPLYSLRAVPAGATAGSSAPADWSFAVTLSCTPDFCRPNLVPGVSVEAGTRWAEPSLAAFIQGAPPGQPVLEAALAAGLVGPVLDFARQLATEIPQPPGTCQCTYLFDAIPPAREVCGKGLEIAVEAQGASGERRLEARRVHQVAVALPLTCFLRVGESTRRAIVKSGSWEGTLDVPVASLLPCTRPCSAGQPNYRVAAQGRLELQLFLTDEDATADADWQLQVTPAGGAGFAAGDSRFGSGSSFQQTATKTAEWEGGAPRLDVQVELQAGLSLPGKHQNGLARSAVYLEVVAEAASLCGDVEAGGGTVVLESADNPEGGLVLDPTQISILIGGGCRP